VVLTPLVSRSRCSNQADPWPSTSATNEMASTLPPKDPSSSSNYSPYASCQASPTKAFPNDHKYWHLAALSKTSASNSYCFFARFHLWLALIEDLHWAIFSCHLPPLKTNTCSGGWLFPTYSAISFSGLCSDLLATYRSSFCTEICTCIRLDRICLVGGVLGVLRLF